jgi:cyanophycinase
VCPASVLPDAKRGWIIPIGGGEKKVRSSKILGRFAGLCGGETARIAVIPTASELDDAGHRYLSVFRDLGVGRAEILPLETREDCEDRTWLAKLEDASGIFFTGGNQLRLSTTIGGTSVARLIRQKNAGGVSIAGTSAGAAFVCEHMIAFGKSGATPRSGMATLAPGLGLTNRVIVDQHFRQRDRIGRLLSALAYNPFATGFGIDEDTAAFIGPDDVVEVLGSGGLTVIDPSKLQFSSMDTARMGQAISLIGLNLHILLEGDRYDLHGPGRTGDFHEDPRNLGISRAKYIRPFPGHSPSGRHQRPRGLALGTIGPILRRGLAGGLAGLARPWLLFWCARRLRQAPQGRRGHLDGPYLGACGDRAAERGRRRGHLRQDQGRGRDRRLQHDL